MNLYRVKKYFQNIQNVKKKKNIEKLLHYAVSRMHKFFIRIRISSEKIRMFLSRINHGKKNHKAEEEEGAQE